MISIICGIIRKLLVGEGGDYSNVFLRDVVRILFDFMRFFIGFSEFLI
jgi:hypothetical protein